MAAREHVLSLRLSTAERDRLLALAEVHGTDQSGVIRRLVAEAPLYSVRWDRPEQDGQSAGNGPASTDRGWLEILHEISNRLTDEERDAYWRALASLREEST